MRPPYSPNYRRPWTPEEDAYMRKAWHDGVRTVVIAEKLDRTQRAVLDHREELGLPLRAPKIATGRCRSRQAIAHLTEDEFEGLRERAVSCGRSISTHLRQLILEEAAEL